MALWSINYVAIIGMDIGHDIPQPQKNLCFTLNLVERATNDIGLHRNYISIWHIPLKIKMVVIHLENSNTAWVDSARLVEVNWLAGARREKMLSEVGRED